MNKLFAIAIALVSTAATVSPAYAGVRGGNVTQVTSYDSSGRSTGSTVVESADPCRDSYGNWTSACGQTNGQRNGTILLTQGLTFVRELVGREQAGKIELRRIDAVADATQQVDNNRGRITMAVDNNRVDGQIRLWQYQRTGNPSSAGATAAVPDGVRECMVNGQHTGLYADDIRKCQETIAALQRR
jgi:hypothetical protein